MKFLWKKKSLQRVFNYFCNMKSLPDLKPFITFRTSRSGGKGGQHVNKTESKAELIFDLTGCTVFPEKDFQLLMKRLRNKLNQEGELIIISEKYRSQISNKEDALHKLKAILTKALTPEKKRIKTKPTKASLENKKVSKTRRSAVKAMRKKPDA